VNCDQQITTTIITGFFKLLYFFLIRVVRLLDSIISKVYLNILYFYVSNEKSFDLYTATFDFGAECANGWESKQKKFAFNVHYVNT